MNVSFRIKLFVIFLVYGLLLSLSGYYFISKMDRENIRKDTMEIAINKADSIDNEFKQYVNGYADILRAIKSSKLFLRYYRLNDILSMQEYFFDVMQSSKLMMQLRLIDSSGMELVRIERDKAATHPFIIPVDHLQNKKNRYYTEAILNKAENTFWYSKLDLNVEHGLIEEPIVPVLRLGTPIYENNKADALLIVNIFMKDFLNHLQNSPYFNIYLIDKDGYILLAPQKNYSWSRYLKQKKQKLPFDKELSTILSNKKFVGEDFVSKQLSLNNNEGITLVLQPKESYLTKRYEENYKEIFYVILIVVFLSLPLSYLLSMIPAKLNSRVASLNKKLQKEQNELKVLLSLFDLSDSVLFKWKNDAQWSVSSVSKSVTKLLGYTPKEFIDGEITYAECINQEDIKRVTQEVESAIKEHKFFFVHKPYRIITKEKKEKWILDYTVIIRNENDEITHFLGYLSDITELKEKEFMLRKLARTDQLTQLYNRVYLDEILMGQYYRFYRNQEPCSLIIIDIDYFKAVNDNCGHLVGDKVLVEFANILASNVREGDVVGRWGGEEFMLILPHTKVEDALILAQKLQKKVREHTFEIVGKKTASFGLSEFHLNATVEQIVEEADQALYEAKDAGRDCIKVYKAEKK